MTKEEAIEKLRLFDFIGSNEDEEFLTALNMAIEALENQKSIIEELEKIKEEIEDIWIKSAKDLKTGEVIYENLCEHSEVLEILANHISELKGVANE